jgi:TRAP-type C4-dicarboxylate transport system permease small subunit
LQELNESKTDVKLEKHPLIRILEAASVRLNQFLAILAGITMVLMMLFTVVNVIIRAYYVPVPGINEMVGWLSAITIAFALGYTQIHRGHVDMEALLVKFPSRIRNMIQSLMLLISMIFFFIISWRLVLYANGLMVDGTLSETLAIIFYPFIYLLAVGFFSLSVALTVDTIKLALKGDQP